MRSTGGSTRWLKLVCPTLVLGLSLLAQGRYTYLPLFIVERNVNANVVHYEAKVNAEGRLDPSEPVVAYWIMAAEDGRRQPLNILEKAKAYGFSTRPNGDSDSYKMFLVSDRRREIDVRRQSGVVHAETQIGGHRAYLQRIFITVRKSRLLAGTPESAELFGLDIATGEACYEKVAADH
jgi:hypothetical protein